MAKAKKKAKTKTPSKQIPKFQKAIQEEISDFLKILEGKAIQEDISDFTKILEGRSKNADIKLDTDGILDLAPGLHLLTNPNDPPIDGKPGIRRVFDAQLQKECKESLLHFSVKFEGVQKRFVSAARELNESVGMLRTIGSYFESPLSAAKQKDLTFKIDNFLDNLGRF